MQYIHIFSYALGFVPTVKHQCVFMKYLKFVTLLFDLAFSDRPTNRNIKYKHSNFYTYFAKSLT
jgi:hypothetical protein